MEIRPATQAASRARPRDRKERIVAAAARRFHRSGYHAVTMGAIAADVGITAGALYRHVRDKQDLLGRVITDRVAATSEALAAGDRLGDALAEMSRLALSVRDLGTLWQRDGRHLAPARRAEVQASVRAMAARLAGLIRAERPGLAYADAEPLAWAVYAVLTSPAFHRTRLDRDRFDALMRRMTTAVCAADLPEAGPAYAVPGTPVAGTRRQTLVTEAGRLFGARGYHAVTMEEIGAAAGIAGPSIYKHFPAKQDLLVAVLDRAAWRLGLDPPVPESDPRAGIAAASGAYATYCLANPHTIGVLFTEVPYLPDAQRRRIVRAQRDYVDAWTGLLAAGGTDVTEARIRVHAALTIANDLARMRRVRERPGAGAVLHALMLSVLRAPSGGADPGGAGVAGPADPADPAIP